MDKIGREYVSVIIAKMDKELIQEIAVRLRRNAAPVSYGVLALLASLGLLTGAARGRRTKMIPEDEKTAASSEASRPEEAAPRPPAASLRQRRSPRITSPSSPRSHRHRRSQLKRSITITIMARIIIMARIGTPRQRRSRLRRTP